jgi:hypothetical protein
MYYTGYYYRGRRREPISAARTPVRNPEIIV